MSVFLDCFRLLFPILPPDIDPPDPGGGGCTDCGGCDPNTDPDCGTCTTCPGADPCDDLVTLCSCGDCGPSDCCNGVVCETKRKSDWISQGCAFTCNDDPQGCINCAGVKKFTPGNCPQCCPSRECRAWACLNPNGCIFDAGVAVPIGEGCCEQWPSPYAWVPSDAICPSPPANNQYIDEALCNFQEQCYKIVDSDDPDDPGGVGGDGDDDEQSVLCSFWRCDPLIGDCVNELSEIEGQPIYDVADCPTTGQFTILGGVTAYADPTQCSNNSAGCCTESTYFYCPSPQQACTTKKLCPYEIASDGTWNGYLMYGSLQGCQENSLCCDTGVITSVSLQDLNSHFNNLFNLDTVTYHCQGRDLVIPPNSDYFETKIGNSQYSLKNLDVNFESPNANVSVDANGNLVISDLGQLNTGTVQFNALVGIKAACNNLTTVVSLNLPVVDCSLGTQCYVDCDMCQGENCYSICNSNTCYDEALADMESRTDDDTCALVECRSGQCLPTSKNKSDWQSILGLGSDADCSVIKNFVRNNPTDYFSTRSECSIACGSRGTRLGLLEECHNMYFCYEGVCSKKSSTIKDFNNTYGTNFTTCTQVYQYAESNLNSSRTLERCQDNCFESMRNGYVIRDSSDTDALETYTSLLRSPYDNDSFIDPIANNRRYNFLKNEVLMVPNNYRNDIFSNKIHMSLSIVLNSIKSVNRGEYFETAFDDIPLDKLELSLSNELRNRLNSIKTRRNFSIKEKILKRLKFLILNDELDRFEYSDIERLGSEEEGYVRPRNLGSETTLLRSIDRSLRPLGPDRYKGKLKGYMELWKTIASDLNKKVPLVTSESILEGQTVQDNDTFTVIREDESELVLSINDGDFVPVIRRDGSETYVPLDSDLSKAMMMGLSETQEAFSLLGQDYDIVLDVSSDETSLIEESYDLSTARKTAYFLKMDPNTLEEVASTDPIVRKTKASFTYVTDPEEINDWIKFKPWPYFNFYVDSNDPFLDHLEEDGKLTATFSDISFKNLASAAGEYPIIPRRIPWHFTLIPTDKTSLLVSTGISKLTGYNSRRYIMKVHPSDFETKQKWANPLYNIQKPSQSEAVNPTKSSDTYIKVEFAGDQIKNRRKIYNKEEVLPRRKTGFRRLLETLKGLKDSGDSFLDDNNTTVSWGNIYKNMSVAERKKLKYDFVDWERSKFEVSNNTLAKDPTVRDRYVKANHVPPRGLNDVTKYKDPIKPSAVRRVDVDYDEEEPEPL